MTWRLLMRRSPTRSMTLVGDVAQTGSLAGAQSWSSVLSPYVGDRWNLSELTVNYRTPEQIMDVAAAVVHAAGMDVRVPTSARVGTEVPVYTRTGLDGLPAIVASEWRLAGAGTVVVITAQDGHAAAAAAVRAALPAGIVTADADALGSPVSVLTVADAKGLEFDTVVLVEPAAILAESSRGINDLYVALSRPTRRLHVVHRDPLPAGMS
jgi:DNA helicase IV